MNTFQYQIIRFLPDRVNGEFINLGVVLYSSELRQLSVEFIDKTTRITQVFPHTNTRYILKLVKHINESLNTIAIRLSDEFGFERYEDIRQITKKVLPIDDSALFFTEPEQLMDVDIKASATYLFDRLVASNFPEHEKEFRNDKEVWRKVYKQYFDKLNISKYLTPVEVSTKFEKVTFEHTWKNGHLNFFETVNFDLEKIESIRHKVFRWAGQIDELKTADEKFHLYLLSIFPDQNAKTSKFIKEFLDSKSTEQVIVEIVTPDNVSSVTENLKREIELHQDL